MIGGAIAVIRRRAEMLGPADGCRCGSRFPGHRNEQVERLDRLDLTQSISCIDRQRGGALPFNPQGCFGIDQALFDAFDVDGQARDAVGRRAGDVGFDQGIGKKGRIGRGTGRRSAMRATSCFSDSGSYRSMRCSTVGFPRAGFSRCRRWLAGDHACRCSFPCYGAAI